MSDFIALEDARPLAALEPAMRDSYYDAYPEMVIDPEKRYEAVIKTEKGEMRFRLFADKTPLAVNNFVFLATEGFYDGVTFHRVIADFMAQTGDPTGKGAGGPGYEFEDETSSKKRFDRQGLLAMANAGPDTNGSQFFITFGLAAWLDGKHTIFGELIKGEDVLHSISLREPGTGAPPGDKIEKIKIFVSSD